MSTVNKIRKVSLSYNHPRLNEQTMRVATMTSMPIIKMFKVKQSVSKSSSSRP